MDCDDAVDELISNYAASSEYDADSAQLIPLGDISAASHHVDQRLRFPCCARYLAKRVFILHPFAIRFIL